MRLFVMGENRWRDESEWPLKRTQYTKVFLHSGGGANSLSGDGSLSLAAPSGDEACDRYVYDPDDPVPTRGGTTLGLPGLASYDQSEIERRNDVLVYTGEPLADDAGNHRTDVDGTVRRVVGARHRFHGEADATCGRTAMRTISSREWCARAFASRSRRPRRSCRSEIYEYRHRPVGDQPSVQGRASPAAGDFIEQLSALRPQSQHRQGTVRRHAARAGESARLPRQPLPFAGNCAGDRALAPAAREHSWAGRQWKRAGRRFSPRCATLIGFSLMAFKAGTSKLEPRNQNFRRPDCEDTLNLTAQSSPGESPSPAHRKSCRFAAGRIANRASRSVRFVRVAATIAIAAALGAGCSKSGPPGGGGFMSGPVPVLIAQAVMKTVPIQLQAIGTIEAYSTVSMRAQIDGKIAADSFPRRPGRQKGRPAGHDRSAPARGGPASGPGQSGPRPRAACAGRQ